MKHRIIAKSETKIMKCILSGEPPPLGTIISYTTPRWWILNRILGPKRERYVVTEVTPTEKRYVWGD